MSSNVRPKWEPIKKPNSEEITGWCLPGRYLPLKIIQDDEGAWLGYFGGGEDAPTILTSLAAKGAQREFLKACLKRARLVHLELDEAWKRLGQVRLAEQKEIEAGK